MSQTKENVFVLIKNLKKKRKIETDADKKHILKIKIDELKDLYDKL